MARAAKVTDMRPLTHSALLLCAALSLPACSGQDPTTPMNTGTGDSAILAGAFQVSLVAPDTGTGSAGYTAVIGKVYDGATPSQIIWTQSSTAGACKLSKPRVPFCNT